MNTAPERQSIEDLKREIDRICAGQGKFQDVSATRDFRAFTPAPKDVRLRDAGPVRPASARMRFGRWLLLQEERGGLIGQLAASAKADKGFPIDGDPDAVRARLQLGQAEGDLFEALDDAELDWCSY